MVSNYLQCAKPQITKTIVRKVQRGLQPHYNKAYLSLLKASNQGSRPLRRQNFIDAKDQSF